MLAAKFFISSNKEDQEAPWSQNPWCKDAVASKENMMNQGKLSSVTIYMYYHFASLEMALKIILIYVQDCEKRNPTQLLKDMREIKSGNSNFVILDKYNFY